MLNIGNAPSWLFSFVDLDAGATQTLEVGALGVALTSTIFALMGFASLEALEIKLYGRLLNCIDLALGVPLAAEASRFEE
jgi:hypothetical protein